MRSVKEIEADISELDYRRRMLSDEREAAVRERTRRMLQMFDDEGLSFNQIAERLEMHHTTVKHLLFNRGRTLAGRNARRAQLASLMRN